jgi:Ala-tRNA(Pro) deacylase
MSDTYHKLIELLDANKAQYRLIDHEPEGQTDKVSALRGHPVDAAAKCIVLIVKIGKKTSKFILAVVPGNARVDTARIKTLFHGATYAGFAAADVAERLAGSAAGTVLPFAFHPDLTLVADPGIQRHEELFFNAAWLDRSMALRTSDYLALAKPRLERIASAIWPADSASRRLIFAGPGRPLQCNDFSSLSVLNRRA